jgi:lipid II:glycine glycyltransferase (peptidoglycan interpeptide bridge formation enzyme)
MSDNKSIRQDINSAKLGSEYQIQVSEDIHDSNWDDFLAKTPSGHHLQTSMWGQVKAVLKWKTIRIIVTDQDHIVAGVQLLIRSIMPFITVAYLTKGPVLSDENTSVAEAIIQYAIQISRENHVQLLAIQPPNKGDEISSLLPAWGFQPSSLELAPTASIIIDLAPTQEQILMQMKRQTRQNIRRSEREGITVREGSEVDLSTFYQLHLATSKRQGFPAYPLDYFIQMWHIFELHSSIKLFIAEYRGEGVSALLVVPFGDSVLPKILGWSGLYPDRRPNDAVFWAAIQWAKTQGYRYFDFEGIDRSGALAMLSGYPLPESLQHSPDFFKLGFGGQVVLYSEAYDQLFNPLLNWAYHKAAPRIGGQDIPSRLVDHLRKR